MKKIHYNNVYRETLRNKIKAISLRVFSRDDLTDSHTNREQLRLNRALHAFMDEGIIIKIGHGLYAKAESMHFPNGEIKAVLTEPFEVIATEALNKLGVQWKLGSAIQDYNSGKTTQIPAAFTVQLKTRFRGSIRAEGRKIHFEGGVNAR